MYCEQGYELEQSIYALQTCKHAWFDISKRIGPFSIGRLSRIPVAAASMTIITAQKHEPVLYVQPQGSCQYDKRHTDWWKRRARNKLF